MAFLEALAQLELPDLLVVTLGRADPLWQFPVEVRQLGQINGQHRVAMVNAAADLVVAPSTEETFGQTCSRGDRLRHSGAGISGCGIARGDPRRRHRNAGRRTPIRRAWRRRCNICTRIPETRRDLARWGRLYVENEWSEFAASRRLYLALRAIDRRHASRLARNLRFLAAEPAMPPFQVVARCRDGWRPCQGFSQME